MSFELFICIIPCGLASQKHCQFVDVDSDGCQGVKDELCRNYTEYGRLKQQALRRMVLQELSTPLPAPGQNGTDAADGQDGQAAEPKKKKRRKAEDKKSEGQTSAFPTQPTAEKENMNDSIRRLYSQSVPANDANLAAKAERVGQDATAMRKAKEKAAMAAARREQGRLGFPSD